MSETARIADQLRRAFEGEAWHGPAVLEILSDVDGATAAARPLDQAHSIWELVLHIAAWDEAVRRRMKGEALTLSLEQNFPHAHETSEDAWRKAVDELKNAHAELIRAVEAVPDSRLTEQVPGKDYDFYFMLHGAVQHELYHAGQIILLKKVAG
jgi:uncharacterized damage-inducible protein DinB